MICIMVVHGLLILLLESRNYSVSYESTRLVHRSAMNLHFRPQLGLELGIKIPFPQEGKQAFCKRRNINYSFVIFILRTGG
jgi:hypothetical protein